MGATWSAWASSAAPSASGRHTAAASARRRTGNSTTRMSAWPPAAVVAQSWAAAAGPAAAPGHAKSAEVFRMLDARVPALKHVFIIHETQAGPWVFNLKHAHKHSG